MPKKKDMGFDKRSYHRCGEYGFACAQCALDRMYAEFKSYVEFWRD